MTDHPPGMVGIPCHDWVYTEAMLSLMNLQTTPGSVMQFEPGGTFPDKKRNSLVESFLRQPELQWLYFSDSDQVVPSDAVLQLLATGLDVVGGLYVSRRNGTQLECGPIPPDSPILAYLADPSRPIDPTGLPYLKASPTDQSAIQTAIDQQAVAEVDWAGGGSLLVRRRVLERMPSPWFCALPGWENEDLYFCAKAAQHGFSAHVDTRVRVGHLGLRANRPAAVTISRGPK